MNCIGCSTTIDRTELLVCHVCKGTYHHSCVNMTSAHYSTNYADLKHSWRCPKPSCTSTTRRQRNDNTPVGKQKHCPPRSDVSGDELSGDKEVGKNEATDPTYTKLPTPPNTSDDLISLMKFEALIDKKLELIKSSLTEVIKSEISQATSCLSAEIKLLNTEVFTLNARVAKSENDTALLRSELEELKQQIGTSTVIELRESVMELKAQVKLRDQAALLNDVELTCVPEFEGESVSHIVTAAAMKLGVKLDERDVVSATRVGAPRGEGAAAAATEASGLPRKDRPRPIVVRLARRSVREELLKSVKVRRGTTTDGMGLPHHVPQKMHINERLTRENRVLFAKAREIGKHWQFIWTKDGLIQARESKSTKINYIRCDDDLERIFGNRTSPAKA